MKAQNKNIYHWLIVIACCGLSATAIGICSNTLGVFYTPVSTAIGVGRGTFAFHATLTALVTGFMGPVVAKLMKKFPVKLLMVFGILVAGTVTILMGFAKNIVMFYILGMIRGFGCAFFTMMPLTTIISNWFEKMHGLAIGIAMSFSGLSGAIFNPLVSSLISKYGWEKSYIITGILIMVIALPGVVFIIKQYPSEKGLLPYGGSMAKSDIKMPKIKAKVNFFSPTFIFMAGFSVILCLVIGIAQHFTGYTDSIGLGTAIGAAMVSAGMVGNILSKLIIGVLSDKIGAFRACETMIVINFFALLSLLFMPATKPVLLISAFFFGFIYSITGAGTPLLVRQVYGAERYSVAYSMINIIACIGSAFSLTIVGFIYDFTGSYTGAFVSGAVFDIIGFACAILVSYRMQKGKD